MTTVACMQDNVVSFVRQQEGGWLPMYKNAGVDCFEHFWFVAANTYIGLLRPGVDDYGVN